ncbi:hypothetical protein [Mycolicibacterium sp.]|uniref:hypothetical protein n=1 Tax=Mycolicibacterium sp. TaxID=2320850 RepID=UPI0037C96A70
MSTDPTPGKQPDFAAENAAKIASESINHYDEASDTYHCSYGPPVPAVTIQDTERDLLVRIDPSNRQVVGFTIPGFRAWHAAHADEDGSFEVELPPVWPAADEAAED